MHLSAIQLLSQEDSDLILSCNEVFLKGKPRKEEMFNRKDGSLEMGSRVFWDQSKHRGPTALPWGAQTLKSILLEQIL